MLEPTNIGKFGRATIILTTPDDHNAFAQLLEQLDCSKDLARIESDAGNLFGSDVSVSLTIERILRPEGLPEELEGPEALLCSEIVIDDESDTPDPEDTDADFAEALQALATHTEDSATWDIHCHLVVNQGDAKLPAPLPIALWNTGSIGALIGGRFQLETSEIEDGSIILDLHGEHIHTTLSLRRALNPTIADIASAWQVVRNIYDDALIPLDSEEQPHAE